jgi:hypothetical protein
MYHESWENTEMLKLAESAASLSANTGENDPHNSPSGRVVPIKLPTQFSSSYIPFVLADACSCCVHCPEKPMINYL